MFESQETGKAMTPMTGTDRSASINPDVTITLVVSASELAGLIVAIDRAIKAGDRREALTGLVKLARYLEESQQEPSERPDGSPDGPPDEPPGGPPDGSTEDAVPQDLEE